jgi:hypothetical protein
MIQSAGDVQSVFSICDEGSETAMIMQIAMPDTLGDA